MLPPDWLRAALLAKHSDASRLATSIALAVVALALASGCSAGGSPGGPSTAPRVQSAQPMPMASGLAAIDSTDAAVIEGFESSVPPEIPGHAVALAAFVAGQHRDERSEHLELVVASVRPTPLLVNVVCVTLGGQVPCSDAATVWEVGFDTEGVAVTEVVGDRTVPQAVLLVVDNDAQRPQLASRAFWMIDAPANAASIELEPVPPVLGGCDVAVLVEEVSPTETFTPLTAAGSDEEVNLVVQLCPDNSSSWYQPFAVVDGVAAHRLTEAPITARPGDAYALSIDLGAYGGSEVQAFVLTSGSLEGWPTWPLSVSP